MIQKLKRLATCVSAETKERTLLLLVTLVFNGYANSQTYKTTIGKAENVTVYTTVDEKNKGKILKIEKYIDPTKRILVLMGMARLEGATFERLKEGFFPLRQALSVPAGERMLKLKLVNGAILISADIDAFDEKYIVKIRDNVPALSKYYHVKATEKSYEVFDDYFIPVLQIELIKEQNAIRIGGAFNHSKGFTIISQSGMIVHNLTKPKLLMSQKDRDSAFNAYLEIARTTIEPLDKK